MRDLEIRGAGNVLGAEQHGHMEAVGYDLYCKLLKEAVLLEKGETPPADFETSVDFPVNAFLPSFYIKNEALRLDIYKKIAGIGGKEELEDVQDELIDRFGDLPKPVATLLAISLVKAAAHEAGIAEVSANTREIRFVYQPQAEVDTQKVPAMLERHRGALKYTAGKAPGFLFTVRGGHDMDGKVMIRKAMEILEKDLLPLAGAGETGR